MTTAFHPVAVVSAPARRPALSAVVYATSAALLALHAVLAILMLPFTLLFDRDRRAVAHLGSWMARTAVRATPIGRRAARGLDAVAVSRDRPAVIVMNHRSLVDIALAVATPGAPKIVSKPWPARVPLLGLCMRLCGHLVFDPTSPRSVRDLVARASRLIARGESVLFFPEGTRRTGGGVGPFASGAFLVATRTQTDVLPVVLHGTGELVPKRSIVFHDAPIDVTPLPRVAPGRDRRALARRVRAAMAASLAAHD